MALIQGNKPVLTIEGNGKTYSNKFKPSYKNAMVTIEKSTKQQKTKDNIDIEYHPSVIKPTPQAIIDKYHFEEMNKAPVSDDVEW